jgi:hypothetical protein
MVLEAPDCACPLIAHTAGSLFVDRRNVVGVAKNTSAISNIRGAEELGEPLN